MNGIPNHKEMHGHLTVICRDDSLSSFLKSSWLVISFFLNWSIIEGVCLSILVTSENKHSKLAAIPTQRELTFNCLFHLRDGHSSLAKSFQASEVFLYLSSSLLSLSRQKILKNIYIGKKAHLQPCSFSVSNLFLFIMPGEELPPVYWCRFFLANTVDNTHCLSVIS